MIGPYIEEDSLEQQKTNSNEILHPNKVSKQFQEEMPPDDLESQQIQPIQNQKDNTKIIFQTTYVEEQSQQCPLEPRSKRNAALEAVKKVKSFNMLFKGSKNS